MAALWAAGTPLTPQRLRSELGFGLARTTVATIVNRLYEEGLVRRERQGRGFVYAPYSMPRD